MASSTTSRVLHGWLLILLAMLGMMPPAAAPAQWGRHAATVAPAIEPTEAAPGAEVTVRLTVTVDAQYHLYAMNQKNPGPGPIPVAITLETEPADVLVAVEAWREPTPVTKFDKGFERDIEMLYGSPLVFERRYRVAPGTAPGAIGLKGSFRYQACTEESCLPPMTQRFTLSLKVIEGTATTEDVAAIEAATAPAPAEPATTPAVQGLQSDLAARSFGGFLIFAFLFGLAALATPCVFPMIPITVSFFTGKGKRPMGQAVGDASVYVLSIVLGFTLIGFGISLLLLAFGGGVEQSGFANRLAANPWVNIFFALLYLFFALSLFEVFHLQLPSSWTQRLNSRATGSGGWLGIFFKALVFVVISFTCTAPLIGILIVQTLGGEWTRPLFGMMAFSAGFALPFFFLALVPQMISALPRAGNWLYTTKVVMGMLVIAAAFKFVSNADIVLLHRQMIFTRELLLAVWAMVALTTALFLFGMIRLGDSEGGPVGAVQMMLGMMFGTVALYFMAGLAGRPLHGWVEAYLPPDLNPTASAVAGAAPVRNATGGDYTSVGFSWFQDVEAAKAQAARLNRRIFIDFTGYTCTNCRLMEKNMFPRPAVTELLDGFVRVKLYTDDPVVGEKNLEYQATTFNTVTLPFYVIMSPTGEVLATEVYTTDEARFVRFLQMGS